jgi:hypothetical protein
MEDQMYEEMRAREAIRRNIVIYGLEEQNKYMDKERMEADLAECKRVIRATGVRGGLERREKQREHGPSC